MSEILLKTCADLHSRYSWPISMKLEFPQQNFSKTFTYKISWKYVELEPIFSPCGQTDMTKLIIAFRNFANAPDNCLPKDARRFVFIEEAVFTVRNELGCYGVFDSLCSPSIFCPYRWAWTFFHLEISTSHWTDNIIILAYHLLILKILFQVQIF
jgi:hypothetical protein